MPEIILASSSPQRSSILAALGVPFSVIPSAVDESACVELDPRKRAVVLAIEKAQDVAKAHKGCIVIGCDTLVVGPDGTLLEKPSDEADARRMLALQSGGRSIVHSGICVVSSDGASYSDVCSSKVYFRKLTPHDIDAWIASGMWKDRSGSFQIDGRGQMLIENIEGEFYAIVGLPVFLLGELLRRVGVQL